MKKRDSRTDPRTPRRGPDQRGPDHRGPGPRGGGGGGGASYWIYGTHAALAALGNPDRRIRRILATAEAAKGLEGRRLPLALEPAERAEIDRLLPAGSVHQGIAVLVEPLESLGIEDVGRLASERAAAVVVVLDQVTDPHNVGAILRSAAAFGALAVVVPDRHAPEETGALAKAASGALERMPLVRVTNVVRALEELKQAGFWIAGLDADGPKTLAEAALSGKVVMALGAEGEGLRRLTREHCDHLVRLPMTEAVESLNVSNACAVALYELRRGG
ncbi:23S rRNA (guanosine(2251)-2'-O)-methyltransferase RlmB [Paramagnetospirillum marisnigri]|uniref:23S rRNA (Guanosine(2251)-2'-O)-methyltransferase RlmB n=1 Tax=Paramagnetospirillum marisnigri TaxID=1285242 RepID=A0A178MDB4_9PROT|nr:23S rRNA (guanosine(2251)-2'-O)-methyltransferase RlmB [Paramagnetospirillum marisnigri]OAN46762.1 23S rRNA (guanosine(2251)-2'-O)-methyltransferase RlmB [Paramagnetospirillum marisnigri]